MVWTTTPWTIAANEAILFSSSDEYSAVLDKETKRMLLVAKRFVTSLPGVVGDAGRFEELCSTTGGKCACPVHPLSRLL